MYTLRGVLLPDGDAVTLHVDGRGYLVDEPAAGSEVLVDGGWIVPGLVDAHCHVGLGPAGPVDLDEAAAFFARYTRLSRSPADDVLERIAQPC